MMVLALHTLIAVFVFLAFPLALVVFANHAGLTTSFAVGIDFAFVDTLFVLTEGLLFWTIGVFDTFHAAIIFALGSFGRTIAVLATFLALLVAALHHCSVAFLFRTVIIISALRERGPATDCKN